jgi:toxin ParE1/3/4
MRVSLTSKARRDLFAIWHHIADQSPSAADGVVRRIEQRYRRLSFFLYRGTARPDVLAGVRMLVLERWLVFYLVKPDSVLILRIVDASRDLSNVSIVSDEDEG